MLFAQYLPSALSKVAIRSLFCATNDCCLLVSLSRTCSCWWVSLIRPNFLDVWNSGICLFTIFYFMRLSSGFKFGDTCISSAVEWVRVWWLCASSDTTQPVPLWVSLMVALSVSTMYGGLDAAFSVVACCALLRNFPSCVIHLCSWFEEGICLLVHIGFCLKTLHLGTVSVSCMVIASAGILLLC